MLVNIQLLLATKSFTFSIVVLLQMQDSGLLEVTINYKTNLIKVQIYLLYTCLDDAIA